MKSYKGEEPKEGTEKWEISFEKNRPRDDEKMDATGESKQYEFGYKHKKGDWIHGVTDWGNIKKFIRKEKEESFREGQMLGGLNAFPICLEEIEEAKKQARKEVLEELEKKIDEKYGRDGGAALVIVENTESGVSQRPGHEEVKELISHLK